MKVIYVTLNTALYDKMVSIEKPEKIETRFFSSIKLTKIVKWRNGNIQNLIVIIKNLTQPEFTCSKLTIKTL